MEPTARILYTMAVIEVMSADERAAFIDLFNASYCQHCGSDLVPCHCSNDE
jgi:hypothetical protein